MKAVRYRTKKRETVINIINCLNGLIINNFSVFYISFLLILFYFYLMMKSVVATTRHSRTNDLTMSKALSRAIK